MLQRVTNDLLRSFESLSPTGMQKIKEAKNASQLRGIYVIEISCKEGEQLMETVRQHRNVSAIVDCIRFYDFTEPRAQTILDKVDDEHFKNAVHTHNMKDQLILCTWIYNGENATTHLREADDFGIGWAIYTS